MNIYAFFAKLELDNKKLILVGLVFLFVLYIDIGIIMKAQVKGNRAAFEKITKLKKDIAAGSAELTKAKNPSEAQSKPVQLKKLITEEQLPELLQDIYTIANRNKINIAQIKPSREVKAKKDAKNPTPSLGQKMIIKLDVAGEYHLFGKFINELENAGQFMAIEEIKIAPGQDNFFVQNEYITVITYVKK